MLDVPKPKRRVLARLVAFDEERRRQREMAAAAPLVAEEELQ